MKKLGYLVVLALCFSGPSLYATTIFSENFNELTAQLSVQNAGQFHTIAGTNVDIVGGGLFGSLVVPPESGNVVDLGGSGGNNPFGLLRSVGIHLTAGTYSLSFDLVGSQRGVTTTTDVSLSGSGTSFYSHDFTLASNDDTSGIVTDAMFTITHPTTVFLTFDLAAGATNIGSLLDNVSIDSGSTSGVPEPSSLFLLGTGLLALVGLVTRSRYNRA